MLKIKMENVGKRYSRGWVFRSVSDEIQPGEAIAILGPNGSGKSTLLRILSGSVTPSQGKVDYELEGKKLKDEEVYMNMTIAAPYLELVEEYTLEEQVAFHFRFKQVVKGVEQSQVPDLLLLGEDRAKPIKEYSSGMLQRVKLGLAILSDTPLVLLDEPTTNLDAGGIEWYNKIIDEYTMNRTVVVCSNRRDQEYHFCAREVIMENYR
jgi:ABC-type multidrug transport system ATPase subunit